MVQPLGWERRDSSPGQGDLGSSTGVRDLGSSSTRVCVQTRETRHHRHRRDCTRLGGRSTNKRKDLPVKYNHNNRIKKGHLKIFRPSEEGKIG